MSPTELCTFVTFLDRCNVRSPRLAVLSNSKMKTGMFKILALQEAMLRSREQLNLKG